MSSSWSLVCHSIDLATGFMIFTEILVCSARFIPRLAPPLSALGVPPLRLLCPSNHALGRVCPASASLMRASLAHPDPVLFEKMGVKGACAATQGVAHRRPQPRQIPPR